MPGPFCDCEDYPCCGCDADGDPRTDDQIKQDVYDRMARDDYDDDHDFPYWGTDMAMNKVVVLIRDPEDDEGNSVTVGPFSSWGRAEAWIAEFGFNLPDSPLEATTFSLYGIREASDVADQYGFSGSSR